MSSVDETSAGPSLRSGRQILYLRERYPARRFVPLAVLVAAPGILPSHASIVEDLRAVALAYLLILAFRIWDDLEDRERDAQLHPLRITVRVTSAQPFVVLLLAVACLATLILISGPVPLQRLALLALLTVALFAWYRARTDAPVVNALVVLAKYPVIAWVAAPVAAPAAPYLLTLYLILCIHEVWDDPILRRSLGRGSSI